MGKFDYVTIPALLNVNYNRLPIDLSAVLLRNTNSLLFYVLCLPSLFWFLSVDSLTHLLLM